MISAARNRLIAHRLTCACGIEDSACMVESQVDGDCSAHDARLAAKPAGYWGVGTDGERAWEVGPRPGDDYEYPEDDENERGRMAETEAGRVCDPGFAFGGAR